MTSEGGSAPADTRATEQSNSAILGNSGELIDLNKVPIELDKEVFINYVETREVFYRQMSANSGCFISKIVFHIELDPESKTIAECKNRQDWDKWKEATENELNSLNKRKVFGPVVKTRHDVIHVGHK